MPKESKRTQAAMDDPRARLLDAAERVFAEKGFSAATVRDITALAGCNVAAVNYYFGGKESLYREMFRRILQGLRELRVRSIQAVMEGEGGLPDLQRLLDAFVSAFLEPFVGERGHGSPQMRLMTQEMLNPHLPEGMIHGEMIHPIQSVLGDALRRLCPGLTEERAALCVQSLVGQLIHVAVHLRHQPGHPVEGRERPDLSRTLRHIVRFTEAGIRSQACVEEESP
jgi:AcrR family transcriptional regulator